MATVSDSKMIQALSKFDEVNHLSSNGKTKNAASNKISYEVGFYIEHQIRSDLTFF